MKVTQLLERSPLAGAATYDSGRKMVTGAADDWMELIGATPADIKEALGIIKKTPEFKAIVACCPYISKAQGERIGTLVFAVGKEVASVTVVGQIRFMPHQNGDMSGRGRYTSPKPHLVHGKPVDSIVSIWKRALIELAKKPKVKTMMDKMAPMKEDIDPKTEGWYIKQQQGDKTWKIVAGPMDEDAADKVVAEKGGAQRGIAKAFVSKLAISKAAADIAD
jgi:hypothetical protein